MLANAIKFHKPQAFLDRCLESGLCPLKWHHKSVDERFAALQMAATAFAEIYGIGSLTVDKDSVQHEVTGPHGRVGYREVVSRFDLSTKTILFDERYIVRNDCFGIVLDALKTCGEWAYHHDIKDRPEAHPEVHASARGGILQIITSGSSLGPPTAKFNHGNCEFAGLTLTPLNVNPRDLK